VWYVGYTVDAAARRKKHRTVHPTWQWIVLGVYLSRRLGLEREKYWIGRLRAIGHPLTNRSPGGAAGFSFVHSDAAKAKMRAAAIGRPSRPHTEEERRRMSEANTGRRHQMTEEGSNELRRCRILSNRYKAGVPLSEAHKTLLRTRMTGNRNALGHKQSASHRANRLASYRRAIARRKGLL